MIDVISLPSPNRDALQDFIGSLAVMKLPTVGQTIDGYVLEKVMSAGHYGCLFLARDTLNQARVVLKFPHPKMIAEREYYLAFVREAWIGAHVQSPWVVEVIVSSQGRQSRLYTVMPYYAGKTLEQLISHSNPASLKDGIAIALSLCKAIHALHRLRIIHRDIKPDNILMPQDGGLKLLDLGVARLPAWDEEPDAPIPGTASYMAPE
ncbi:MAG: serine/threonine protein kinase, partial [Candidatus Methylumidiphilus sp.]